MEARVKQEFFKSASEITRHRSRSRPEQPQPAPEDVIELSDSDDDNAVTGNVRVRDSNDSGGPNKKQKLNGTLVSIPQGFLDPLPPLPESSFLLPPPTPSPAAVSNSQNCKQFWKAGDYEGAPCGNWDSHTGGMDHVRVHPKFLHSNATSHKWALGAFAELLDNSLDEVCNGATYVNIDMLMNKKDKSKVLLIEDNGGGMDPDKLRQCMSLGYSAKSKLANTIGQYGNGFKTSTMRLGADVIVFSRCSGKDGKSVSQSIGLLSYTFLRSTGKEDIVVPILDYERKEGEWQKMMRSSADDWNRNVDTIVNWSPYSSEGELLQQFNMMKDHGTRIIIYNLWEDDQGQLELDFDSDQHDIQIRGVNRDEKNIQMAKEYPNSRHFLTYRHSLRSYVSILYLRLPPNFRIILRGRDVEHHNVVNDMMLSEEVTYRPQPGADGVPRDANMVAIVTVGFVKDAKAHIDVQGFNVYHKNRLIKPFWRVWNAAGSDGRGVIGVLEANFVEPAHDKQGFERTTVLARLENKLVQMQKTYWSNYCHKIGYAPRRNKKQLEADRESSPDYVPSSKSTKKKIYSIDRDKFYSPSSRKQGEKAGGKFISVNEMHVNGHAYCTTSRESFEAPSSPSSEDSGDAYELNNTTKRRVNGTSHPTVKPTGQDRPVTASQLEKTKSAKHKEQSVNGGMDMPAPSNSQSIDQLKEENRQLKERLESKEETLGDLRRELQEEQQKMKSLELKLQEAEGRIDILNKEQESLIDIFSEERDRRDVEEENLRKRIREASNTIEELREKVKVLENMRSSRGRR